MGSINLKTKRAKAQARWAAMGLAVTAGVLAGGRSAWADAAYAWGFNNSGQLGNGTMTNSTAPVAVTGLSTGVTAVAAGSYQSLAVQNGGVWAWGENTFGQLGNGTTTSSYTPAQLTGTLSGGVTAIAGGGYHSLAVKNGGVWAWGYNLSGQLGNGTTTDSHTPVALTGLLSTGVTAIAAGYAHSLAVRSGGVWAWGLNGSGELGNGTTSNSGTPVALTGTLSSGVTAIAGGDYHSLAVQNGGVYAWGYNAYGQLGNGTTTDSHTPVQVTALSSGVTAVAGGYYHSLAVQNGGVWAWGYNGDGELGDGTTANHLTPERIDATDLNNIVSVGASVTSSYALSADGSLWVWGDNGSGTLGLGTTTTRYLTPQHLLPPTGYVFTSIDANDSGVHALATLAPAGPHTWKTNGSGNWSDTARWTNSVIPSGAGTVATLAATDAPNDATPVTATIDSSYASGLTVGTIHIDHATKSYTIAAATPAQVLTLQGIGTGSATIETVSGSHTISAPIVLASLTNLSVAGTRLNLTGGINYGWQTVSRSGAGELHISGTQTGSGATFNATGAGTTYFESSANGLAVTADSGATVRFSENQSLSCLKLGAISGIGHAAISGSQKVVTVTNGTSTGIQIGAGSALDVGGDTLVWNYSGVSTPAAAIRTLLTTGYNGGTWTGNGINSSVAAAHSGTALGYTDSGSAITVKYTWAGDATLDRVVNFNDLSVLAQHYGQTSGQTWQTGDFTYDGIVNFNDLSALAQHYGFQPTGLTGTELVQLDGVTPNFAADVQTAFAMAAVPEPASLGVLAIGAMGLLARRRRVGPDREHAHACR